MASSSFHFLSLAILVIAGNLVLRNHGVFGDQCQDKIPQIVTQCSQFVGTSGPETPPSQGCCKVIDGVDVECICQFVTPEVEKVVSMKKVVDVARACGLNVPPGLKCGSFTVPPPLV